MPTDLIEQLRADLARAAIAEAIAEARSEVSPWFYGDSFAECFAQLAAWEKQVRTGTTCWEILGVPPGASEADIKKAYRTMAKEMHPDAGGSEASFKKLNQAFHDAIRESRGERAAE